MASLYYIENNGSSVINRNLHDIVTQLKIQGTKNSLVLPPWE